MDNERLRCELSRVNNLQGYWQNATICNSDQHQVRFARMKKEKYQRNLTQCFSAVPQMNDILVLCWYEN